MKNEKHCANNNYLKVTHILLIITSYCIAHWGLLIVSGYWWDDAIIRIRDIASLQELYRQTGFVFGDLFAIIMISCKYNYRCIVFVLGLITSILIYLVARESEVFDESASFWVGAFFNLIPINDARVTYICFPYTISLFLFSLSFFQTIIWKKGMLVNVRLVRIISLILLLLSYTTGSILVMTSIIIVWLLFYDIRQNVNCKSVKSILDKVPKILFSNIDYVLLPIVYWVIKSLFFQAYGPYKGYNTISRSGLFLSLVNLPLEVMASIKHILDSYMLIISKSGKFVLVILVTSFVIGIFIYFQKEDEQNMDNMMHVFGQLIIGFMLVFLGVFPYVAVGRSGGLYNTGVVGRDSLLIGFGGAICIYCLGKIFFKEWFRYTIYVLLMILGIIHFNYWYANYQKEWYKNLEFQDAVASVSDLKTENTFWVVNQYETPCGSSSFYYRNVSAYEVDGNQSRMFSTMRFLADDFQEAYLHYYGMDDYDNSDRSIDGIIILNDNKMSIVDLIKLKGIEIKDYDKFAKEINSLDRYEYYPITEEESDYLIDTYRKGITDDAELFYLFKAKYID